MFFKCWKSSFIYCQKSHSLHIRFGNSGQIGFLCHENILERFTVGFWWGSCCHIFSLMCSTTRNTKDWTTREWTQIPASLVTPVVLLLNDTNITNGVMARVIAASAVDYVLKPRYGSKPKTIKLVFAVSPISVQQ